MARRGTAGEGEPVRRQHTYAIRLRLKGCAPVRWSAPSGPVGIARLGDEGETLLTEVRVSRGSLVNGLFYGLDGMRVGGTRRLEISPHLAYAERGLPGTVPADAVLIAEVMVLGEGALRPKSRDPG